MRKFTALVTDNIYKYQLVYSEASFNMAAFQLEYEGFKVKDCRMVEEKDGREVHQLIMIKDNKEVTFIYDEERGYLLRKDVKDRG